LLAVPASWLRASCPCPSCLDPHSGQRLVSITDLPAEVALGSVTEHEDSFLVTFEPDGHRAAIAKSWLAGALAAAPPAGRTEDAKRLWIAADFAAGPPLRDWDRYRVSNQYRADCLDGLVTDGFLLVQGVPAAPGMVLQVAGSMGFVRETNYGRLFDVRATIDPANLAYTALAIAPHTDNPYRDPVPTVQLLHCLASAAEGGDSGLVDGFAAADLLRAEDPGAFGVLTGTPVTFRYADRTTELQAAAPLIGLDARRRIREVRFNNRSMQPLPLSAPAGRTKSSPAACPGPLLAGAREPGAGPALGQALPGAPDPGAANTFYRAYRTFAKILLRPELMLTFRLSPGECVVIDNTRVLHARTAFTSAGRRHLQGCYADLDGVESELAVLRRAAVHRSRTGNEMESSR
jgi:gamma-butyrobetaine dioxygenase